MRTSALLVAIWLCLLAAGVPAVATADGGLFQQGGVEADFFRLEVSLDADGDAQWRVVFQQTLSTEAEREGFEDLRADIEATPREYTGPFEQRMQAMVRDASDATGREMELGEVTVETTREQRPQDELGNVVYTFEWRGFASTDGERVRAGDALAGLPLEENELLQMTWPDTLVPESATPDPDTLEADSATWQGPVAFGTEEPRIVLAPTESDGSSDGTADTDDGTGTTDSEADDGADSAPDGLALELVAVGAVALLVVTATGAALVRRRGRESTAPVRESKQQEGDGRDPDLLSPREQVLHLLRDNDGRMKQKRVAEEIGWSSARTSQVVGQLREQGAVETFRIGRENVVTLPNVAIEGDDAPTESDEK